MKFNLQYKYTLKYEELQILDNQSYNKYIVIQTKPLCFLKNLELVWEKGQKEDKKLNEYRNRFNIIIVKFKILN